MHSIRTVGLWQIKRYQKLSAKAGPIYLLERSPRSKITRAIAISHWDRRKHESPLAEAIAAVRAEPTTKLDRAAPETLATNTFQFKFRCEVPIMRGHHHAAASWVPSLCIYKVLRRGRYILFAVSSADAAAAVRVSTPSRSRMCWTCFDTVRGLMSRIIAISRSVLPTAM